MFALSLLAALLLARPTAARADYLWSHDVRGGANTANAPSASVTGKAGDVIVSGYLLLGTGQGEIDTIAYAHSGAPLWHQVVPVGAASRSAVTLDPATGNVLVVISPTNTPFYTPGYPLKLVKYSPTGTLLLAKTLDAPIYTDGIYVNRLLPDAAGDFYLVGEGTSVYVSGFSTAALAIKYSPDGTELWKKSITNPSEELNLYYYSDAVIDSEGDLIAVGADVESGQALIVKYASDGDKKFRTTLTIPYEPTTEADFVALDASDNIYINGKATDGDGFMLATAKYSPLGQQLWVEQQDGEQTRYDAMAAGPLVVDAAGDVIISGESSPTYGSDKNYRTLVKYDSDGNKLWLHTTVRPYSATDYVSYLFSDAQDNIYTVESVQVAPFVVGLSKLDAGGNSVWRENYIGAHAHPGDAFLTTAAFDAASGTVFVSGTSDFDPAKQPANNLDWFTAAYQP